MGISRNEFQLLENYNLYLDLFTNVNQYHKRFRNKLASKTSKVLKTAKNKLLKEL